MSDNFRVLITMVPTRAATVLPDRIQVPAQAEKRETAYPAAEKLRVPRAAPEMDSVTLIHPLSVNTRAEKVCHQSLLRDSGAPVFRLIFPKTITTTLKTPEGK